MLLYRRRHPPTGHVHSPTGDVHSPTGQLDSPTGQLDSPTGQVDSPIGQINSPTGQVNSPIGRVDSPTGYVNQHTPSNQPAIPDRAGACSPPPEVVEQIEAENCEFLELQVNFLLINQSNLRGKFGLLFISCGEYSPIERSLYSLKLTKRRRIPNHNSFAPFL
jgi:hypothetical protein